MNNRPPRANPVIIGIVPFLLLFVSVAVFLPPTLTNPLSIEYGISADSSSSNDDAAKPLLRKNNNDRHLPIAWSMSFPVRNIFLAVSSSVTFDCSHTLISNISFHIRPNQNSGTSFTSELVRTVTRHNTASNYRETTAVSGESVVPVFKDSPRGPYWTDPLQPNLSRPTRGYILTKTHCGGYCDQCPPERYIETPESFLQKCLSGDRIIVEQDGVDHGEWWEGEFDSYSKELLGRAVHVIRDPFDNIVSRFHLTYKHFGKTGQTDKLELYPRSRDGFRSFCDDMDQQFYQEELATEAYRDVLNIMTSVPCHADFFRYIQWHNLAFETTADLAIPTMVIHYENYTNNFDETKDRLLEFLGQEATHDPPEFETGKTYREYFTEQEIEAVSTMFSRLVSDKTWMSMKHYLDPQFVR